MKTSHKTVALLLSFALLFASFTPGTVAADGVLNGLPEDVLTEGEASIPAPSETPVSSEALEGDVLPAPEETPDTSESPAPAETMEPSETPVPSDIPEPAETPVPSETEEPEETPAETPSETPDAGATPAPSDVPEPAETPSPIETEQPAETPAPSDIPEPAETPTPSETGEPEPSESPEPSETEDPEESPEPSESPDPDEDGEEEEEGETFTISYALNGGAPFSPAFLMETLSVSSALAGNLSASTLLGGAASAMDGAATPLLPSFGDVTGRAEQIITLAAAPYKPERTFACWQSARTGETYRAGDEYVITGDDTLTAQWNMLQLLEFSVQPEENTSLCDAADTVSAISETQQTKVETAVAMALSTEPAYSMGVLASDVTLLNAEGAEQQPSEGETVPVYLTVPENVIPAGADFLLVYHMLENGDGTYTAQPVEFSSVSAGDQKIYFEADGFSIYAVSAVGVTDGTQVNDGEIFLMQEEEHQVFYFKDETNTDKTYRRYTWSVENNDNVIRAYSTPMEFVTSGINNYKYPWISVDALSAGTATLVLTYYYHSGPNWWKPNGTQVTGTIRFKIGVTEPEDGLRLENTIYTDGSLHPKYTDENGETPEGITYAWTCQYMYTYNDGNTGANTKPVSCVIDREALLPDGGINIAIDAGGIAQTVNDAGENVLRVKTYTCTAYDADGKKIASASHRVEYGEDILNGSFEYPRIPFGTGYAFANHTRQLFWMTTAPGTANMLGQDVELGNDSYNNPYLTSGAKANDGDQYAELNAEAMGTLFQDVLTAPGATLSWGFAHRSRRGTGINVMYLIISASKDAQKIATQSDINALIQNYQGDGATITYNGAAYTLWKFEGNEYYWQEHRGTYTVPHNQYATRFFFASATGTTLGNLIDGVHFNEEQRYIIEYYLNGVLQDELTEIDTVDIDTVVSPKYLDHTLLKNAILTASTMNGTSYGGTAFSVKARTATDAVYTDCRNVLRLYYTTGAATVKKVVEIESWDDLTDDERDDAWGDLYTADFLLYDGETAVASAQVSIDLNESTLKTGIAQFVDLETGDFFRPETNKQYRVAEVSTSGSVGDDMNHLYTLTTAYSPDADGYFTTDEHGNGTMTVTNRYALELAELTIRKRGAELIDENQSFVFRVLGNDTLTRGIVDLTVVIHGNGSVTIKGLPTGSYLVEEVTDWSWRYTPEQAIQTVILTGPGVVTFQNTRAQEPAAGETSSKNGWKWLNGAYWIDNRWTDNRAHTPDEP